jgi:NAD-dependent deacetylase
MAAQPSHEQPTGWPLATPRGTSGIGASGIPFRDHRLFESATWIGNLPPMPSSEGGDQIAVARRVLRDARKVVVLTGAGISTDSGIPDFRGPDGLWTKNPAAERLSTLDVYMHDPEVRRRAWRNRLDSPTWTAQPNAGHEALVALERQGKMDTLVTQNIDGLHQLAGSDPAKVIEIHGTMREVVCMECQDRGPAAPTLDRVRAGESDPACLRCGGILKSATISFGQSLVAADLVRAERAAARCDALLAIGTTLTVYPAAGLVPTAADSGAPIVIVNAEATPYDHITHAVVRDPISSALSAIVEP